MPTTLIKIHGDSMWPTLKNEEKVSFFSVNQKDITKGDIVVASHPFKPSVTIIKRITKITNKGFFLEGDNPDPTASEDSHNFGVVPHHLILGKVKI